MLKEDFGSTQLLPQRYFPIEDLGKTMYETNSTIHVSSVIAMANAVALLVEIENKVCILQTPSYHSWVSPRKYNINFSIVA
jgi:hypothetical protein